MKSLIVLLLAVFPVGQLARVNVPGTEIVLHLNDFVVLVAAIFWLWKRPKISGPLVKPLLFFGIAIALSLLVNITRFTIQELSTAALYPLRFFAYASLYFLFRDLSAADKKLAIRWLLISTLIIAAFGLAQYVFVPNVAFLSALDWDDHYYRLIGSFLDPGFTGAILVLGLLLVYLCLQKTMKQWSNLTIVPVYVALALTYSRASYLMYLASFAAISVFKKSPRIFVAASLILLITLIALPRFSGEGTRLSRENSIVARLKNWGISLGVWRQSPILGVGFNTYRYVIGASSQSHSGGADSSILLVLATTGILGLTAYCYLLTAMYRVGSKNLLFKAGFLGVIVHSFFNNTLFYPWIMEWLWIVLAVTADT